MRRRPYWLVLLLLLGGCALLPKTDVPVASPSAGGDQTVGVKVEEEVTLANEGDSVAEGQGDASTGGGVGKIGGDGDSVALWMAIVILGVIALSAYPAQRYVRLAWNSWRGRSGPRKGKGWEVCVKFSEWESPS